MRRRVLVVDDSATLRRIMRAVLEAEGHAVDTASDGAEALERVQREAFDLLLVDFVMPRLNGYQLAQAVRAMPGLAALPIVLVSAKAEQIADRFVPQTAAVGALQKPFTPAQLRDAVTGALGVAAAPAPSSAEPDDSFAGLVAELASHAATLEPPPVTRDLRLPEATRTAPPEPVQQRPSPARPGAPQGPSRAVVEAAHARFTEALARALTPAFLDVAGPQADLTEEAVLQVLRFYLPAAKVSALFRELRPLDAGLRGNVVLDGLLEAVTLGEVFQLLALQGQTGLLVVERGADAGGAAVTFALRGGRIDLATGRDLGGEFRLGRYLVEAGAVSRATVETVALSIQGQHVLLGKALARGGFVREEDVTAALTRQTSEALYEVLRWPGGRFRFEAGSALPEAQLARLGLPSDALVMEGYRRLDEWRVLAEYIPSERAVFARDEALVATLDAGALTPDERRVLEAIDGRRAVADVVEHVAMSSFDASKVLYRLLQSRLVGVTA